LGSDLPKAKIRWAELEGQEHHPVVTENSFQAVFEKYMVWAENRKESGLSDRTIKDRKTYWRFLAPVYGPMDIDDIRPAHIMPYYYRRSSKASAKKEIKFLSVLFNWAIARGMMNVVNPITGLTRQMKVDEKRKIYVSDEELALVYKHSKDVLRDALDIAYLTGQRPADVKKLRWDNVKNGYLEITQNKTGEKLRIEITGELVNVLDRIKKRGVVSMLILADPSGHMLNNDGYFRYHFNKARDAAQKEADELGIPFQRFQFRDLRAKAATDIRDIYGIVEASNLLGHTNTRTTEIYIRQQKGKTVKPVMAKQVFRHEDAKKVGNDDK
jgi:integrase